jgi:hypothetical protein
MTQSSYGAKLAARWNDLNADINKSFYFSINLLNLKIWLSGDFSD